MKQTVLILFAALFVTLANGQIKPQNLELPSVFTSFNYKQIKGGWIKYKIDPKIKDSIPETRSVNQMPSQLMTESFYKFLNKGRNYRSYNKNQIGSFVTYTAGDTSNIIMTSSWIVGYRIVIVGDSCKVFVYGVDGGALNGMYKYNKSDTAYQKEILVQPLKYNLTLSKKPAFTAGEIIEGNIEFESQPFFVKEMTPTKVLQFYLKGYFKTFDPKLLH